MIKEALSYPLKSDHRLKTIGIGGLLYLIGSLIRFFAPGANGIIRIPILISIAMLIILLSGYSFRVFKSAAHEEESLPKFTDWIELSIDGLKMAATVIFYISIPALLLLIGILYFPIGEDGTSPFGAVLYISSAGLYLIFGFFLPVALTNIAVTDRLHGAFQFRSIINAALTESYIIAVVLILVFGTILRFIGALLMFIVVGFFVIFYVQVFLTYLAGRGCGHHLIEDGEETVAD